MKNKKTLLGAAATAVIASALLLAPTGGEGVYQLRKDNSNSNTQGYAGAFEYYKQVRMNLETGTVNKEDWLRAKAESELISVNRADIGWKDHGPDNVGGRTRAILIDNADVNHVFAGSVSGGLFVSHNRGNTWAKVNGFVDNLAVSSMCMTANGNIFVGTGHSAEQVGGTTAGFDSGANGNGVYKSTDGGVTFTSVSGTENYTYVNEVVAKGDDIFIGTNTGLKKLSGTTITTISDVSGACKALSISNDGELVVASGTSSKTYVSTNGGSSFSNVSGSINVGKIPQGAQRIEYAISHEKLNGKFVIYASQANSNLKGVFKSIDNGVTWTEIAPANNGTVGSFAPFNSGGSGQGTYDNIISVVKGQPESILLGGINVYAKSSTGNWEQRSNGFFSQLSPLYLHSDQHEMQWDSEGRLWLGNDGGVFFSDDNGNSFHEADRNYNVTQFYKIGASAHGDVIGGAQDNGTQANYHTNATYREHKAVGGGDGFGCAMSFINRDILFSTVYYGAVNRSGDRGVTSNAFTASNIPNSYGTPGNLDPGNGLGSFNTAIELYENPNDLNSTDSVKITLTEGHVAGDVVQVGSLTSQTFIDYTLTSDVLFNDTLFFDPSQTTLDTLVTDNVIGVAYNVNILGYSFIYGAPTIDVGDTLLINGVTVAVDVDDVTTNHYYGTNPLRPGRLIDLGVNEYMENVTWDTLMVQDPYQSWFALGLGAGKGVWLTRNALRLSAAHDGFLLAADGLTGTVSTMEFSGDGNHLFIGTTAGRLYRLSGIDDIYSPNPNISNAASNIKDSLLAYDNGHYSTTFEDITGSFGGAYVTNLASDKNDPDHLIVTLGNYGGSADKVQELTNATGPQGGIVYAGIDGNLPNATPVYSCVIDRNDPNLVLIGTDFGVFRTTNTSGGSTVWENVSGDFGNTPIWDMVQNWRTWDEGCYKPGEIYIGTHGRGIWSTDEYLGVEEAQDNLSNEKFESNLVVYPNPVVNYGTIAFDLTTDSDVAISVYSLTGKLVHSVSKNNVAKGSNTIQFETSDLPNGTYLVRLIAGEMVKTTKFIKQ